MQLTHFGHSCLLAEFTIDSATSTVLFDPGNFSHGFEGITGLDAILITHQHPDHADTERLPALVEANPQAALYADPQTAEQLGDPWRAVHVGDEFTVGSLTVHPNTLVPKQSGDTSKLVFPSLRVFIGMPPFRSVV